MSDIKFYVDGHNGCLLCVDHADRLNERLTAEGVDEDACDLRPYPVYSWDTGDWSTVEYCDDEHSFCTLCGSDLIGKGHPQADIRGPLARCSNCNEESVYVDGVGYMRAGSSACWSDVVESHRVEVDMVGCASAPMYATDLGGSTRITHVLDIHSAGSGNVADLATFVAWMDLDPSAGRLLVLGNKGDNESIDDFASEHFAEVLGLDYDELRDEASALVWVEVDPQRVSFSTVDR